MIDCPDDPDDSLARRHARAMLDMAGVFAAGLVIIMLCSLKHEPDWRLIADPGIFVLSGLIPLIRGPRYVGILMIVNAALLFYAMLPSGIPLHPALTWMGVAWFTVNVFLIGLWPLFERQWAISRADILYPWTATLSLLLGVVAAYFLDALERRHVVGAMILAAGVLTIQSCQRAYGILRGPREARLRRGFPVSLGPDSSPPRNDNPRP